MRIYQDPKEMVREVERDLFEMGIRYQSSTVQDQHVEDDPDYQTIELVGYSYALTGFDDVDEILSYMEANAEWAEAEMNERLGITTPESLNPGEAWHHDKQKWGQFIRDGVFAYSYAERWRHQLPYIIRELQSRPNTRQAVLTMYDVHQDMLNWGGRDRVPCSLTYHFLLRDGKLDLIYGQRSCDFMKFFATDVWITVGLLKHVAELIGVEPGRFIHNLNSLHAFARDLRERKIF